MTQRFLQGVIQNDRRNFFQKYVVSLLQIVFWCSKTHLRHFSTLETCSEYDFDIKNWFRDIFGIFCLGDPHDRFMIDDSVLFSPHMGEKFPPRFWWGKNFPPKVSEGKNFSPSTNLKGNTFSFILWETQTFYSTWMTSLNQIKPHL